jgi:hypothetical protein
VHERQSFDVPALQVAQSELHKMHIDPDANVPVGQFVTHVVPLKKYVFTQVKQDTGVKQLAQGVVHATQIVPL